MFMDTSREEDHGSGLRLTTMLTTASTPATPGPSTPTGTRSTALDQAKMEDSDDEDFRPPARPSSTPFPQQELLESHVQFPRHTSSDLNNLISPMLDSDLTDLEDLTPHEDNIRIPESNKLSPLCSLPIEIHECILDHLFGLRLSASSRSSSSDVLRNWNTKLRHCRRREVSDLALVSKKWRELIQDRLYRHIKIKGTRESIDQAVIWFLTKTHLTPYVKHIEIWFPVFQQKSVADRTIRGPSLTPNRPTAPLFISEDEPAQLTIYSSPHNNCTLEEVFRFIQLTFGEACVLTLEGGERKKPPMVRQFSKAEREGQMPVLDAITTLVCKGQWNLMRTEEDFQVIAKALPNLVEWHGSYAKPKSKSYLSMATIFPKLPENLTHLNLVLESDYRREAVSPTFFRKVSLKVHFCSEMAKAMPALEHFAYTGRVCSSFFDNAAIHSNKRSSRLKSVELTVKNICRPKFQWNDGSGISDANFILAFESLVISACQSLSVLAALDLIRIKFIDLDSQVPSYSPYFELRDNKCTGIWSEKIVEKLSKARPRASFLESVDSPAEVPLSKDGTLLSTPNVGKTRPVSIRVTTYLALSTGITIT